MLVSKNKRPEGIFPKLLHCMQYDRYVQTAKLDHSLTQQYFVINIYFLKFTSFENDFALCEKLKLATFHEREVNSHARYVG